MSAANSSRVYSSSLLAEAIFLLASERFSSSIEALINELVPHDFTAVEKLEKVRNFLLAFCTCTTFDEVIAITVLTRLVSAFPKDQHDWTVQRQRKIGLSDLHAGD